MSNDVQDASMELRGTLFSELDDVRLVIGSASEEGYLPPESRGTVVAVHGGGAAYTIEFAYPVHALLTLEAGSLRAVPGATRERLVAAAAAE